MQDTDWVNANSAKLLAAGQVPLMKLEIEVGVGNWVNLCDLDGKNYVESISGSLGGASMTPKPIGGALSAMLSNEDSIFHPKHPSSGYENYLKTGRKIKASIGAKYNDTDYYWQRMIGYIDEPRFETLDQKVSISGGDFMKLLEDTELRSPDNYWGASLLFDSIPSDGLMGDELYNELDAMDINNEDDNVTYWPVTGACTFASVADGEDGSNYFGKLISTSSSAYAKNSNVATAEAGKEYKVSFKYRRESGTGKFRVSVLQDDGGEVELNFIDELDSFTYETVSFHFTAVVNGPVIMKLSAWEVMPGERRFRIDQISIWKFKPYWQRYYQLPEASKGPYYVTLDSGAGAVPIWQGEEDEGWYHEAEEDTGEYPHPARVVFFDHNKTVAAGEDNLKIYYFTAESLENVVADILVKCGLYADRATALDDMEYDATGITIDKIWFEPGSKCLNAIKKICERCDYRFHFKWDGTPVFKPKPAPISACDAITDWSGTALSIDTADKKEGTGSLKDTVASPGAGSWYKTIYNPTGSWDWSGKKHILVWLKCDRANSAFTNVWLKILDTSVNYRQWNLTFSAGEWTAFKLLLSTGTGESGTPPDLALIDKVSIEFQATDTTAFYKKIDFLRVMDFTFTDQKHIASFSNYQDRNEVKNRIVIEGMKQAEPVNKEETMPPELKGEAHDDTSIATYGERTLTIKNHLFQDQDSINAMCISLLAEYKDPKWYSDVEVPFNPVPLEMGDRMGWKERLSLVLEIVQEGIIRDIKIDNFNTIYKCEVD